MNHKIDLRVEIVRSKIPALNSLSTKSAKAIERVLSQHYAHVGFTIINTVEDLEALILTKPDIVFMGMKYILVNSVHGFKATKKIWLADYFDAQGIAYTGSGSIAHETELNKDIAKRKVSDAGLKTSAFCVINKNNTLDAYNVNLSFPLFVKPTNRGGGAGIDTTSVVRTHAELHAKVLMIANTLSADSLVEEYLPGKEFSVAILKSHSTDNYHAMPIELIALPDSNGDRMLSSVIKKTNDEGVHGVHDTETHSLISNLALGVFEAIGGQDYGRIDIRLDSDGTANFLEANLIPSLIENYGSFPKACELNSQINYEDMLLRIMKLATDRLVA